MYSLFEDEDLYSSEEFLCCDDVDHINDLIVHDCEMFYCDSEEKKETFHKRRKRRQSLDDYTDDLSIF